MRSQRRRALAITIALGVTAVACGGGDDDTSNSTDPPPGTPADAGASTPGTATVTTTGGDDAAPTDPDATLRLDNSIDLTNLDPHLAQYSYDQAFLVPVYDRLFDVEADGTVIPMLATEYAFDDTGTTLELTLREGVTFHDGTPFDAAAVKANIERGQTIDGSTVAADLAGITAVDVVDPTHVRFTLSSPNVSLISDLADRSGAMISPAAFETDLTQTAVGAGPFRLLERTPGVGATYERYDDYWDPGAAAVARLEISVHADPTTRLNAIRSGQSDITGLSPSQYEEARDLPGLVTTVSPGPTYNHLLLNRTRSEFGDVRVREAIYHAIDRQAICDSLLFGLCDLSVQPLVPGHFASNPDFPADYYDYDPERARELLAEAGLPDGFSFELMTPAALSPYPETGEILQAQLAEVGIDVTLTPVEPAQMGERMFVKEETDALLGGQPGIGDPSSIYATSFLADSFANPGGHTTPRMEELYQLSVSTFDEEERREVLFDAQAEIVESVLAIILNVPNAITIVTDDVVGYETGSLRGYASVRYVGIAA